MKMGANTVLVKFVNTLYIIRKMYVLSLVCVVSNLNVNL